VKKERGKIEEKKNKLVEGKVGGGAEPAPRCEAAKIEYGIRDPYPIGIDPCGD
jgi:hypothetical protein